GGGAGGGGRGPAAGQTLPRAGPGGPERRGRRPRLLPGNGRRAGGASRSWGTLRGRGGLRARDIAWIGRLGKAGLSIFCLRLPTRMGMRIGRPGGPGRPRLGAPRRGTTVYVACSSLCFGRYPLAQALHTISELNFHKVDLALHESGPHVKPSQVLADVNKVAQVLRKANVTYAA